MMDLMDRKAVLEALDELDSHQTMSRYLYRKDLANVRLGISMAVDTVKALQTVEPVRHGQWVDATGVLDSVRQYKCSECGKKPILNEHWCFELTKFCPFCGAKMED